MEERVVIVAYKPLRGKEKDLQKLVGNHYPILKKEGLVSDRKPIIAKASDETIIEVFGWKSGESIDKAHENEVVQNLWEEFNKVCEYIPIGKVKEAETVFSEFQGLSN